MMTPTRRQFLRLTAALGLGGAAAAVLEKFALTTAWAQTQTDYKALVCVFMGGGNDGNNMVVPLSGGTGFGSADVTGGWPAYFNERNLGGAGLVTATAGTLLPPASGPEPTGSLLRINPGAANPNLGMFGLNWFLGTTFNSVNGNVTIPIPSFKALYDLGKSAVVCNVGTLIQPISKAQYQAGIGRPNQLFSHSDQVAENSTCVFSTSTGTGWGGRTADKTVFINGTGTFPMGTSVSGFPQFMSGVNTFPLVISPAPTGIAA